MDYSDNTYLNYYNLEPGPLPPCPPPPPPPEKEERRVSAYEELNPVKRPAELFPIPPCPPPPHTQIQPRCFTCQHFEMCSFRKDYLKTITLLQRDLGSPQRDYELSSNYITIPGFIGFPIINEHEYFPKEISFNNCDDKGKLWLSKFNGINYVNVVYKVKKYYVLLKFKYDNETELYNLKSCEEAFYGIEYELSETSLEEIQLGLMEWREVIINATAPPPPPPIDIINTTHFSASLNCDMYEWNKKSFEVSIEELLRKYPKGIPIGGRGEELYHIATFHEERGRVPYSPLLFPQKEEKKPKPPRRRDDI